MGDVDAYFVHTPLHILFTLNLLHHEPTHTRALVFILADFPDSHRVAERMQHIIGERHRVLHLPGSYRYAHQSVSTKIRRHLSAVRASVKARQIYRTVAVKRLIVFNDTRSEIQEIIYDLRRRGVEQVLYVEDGLGAYYQSQQKRNPRLAPFLRFLYRGAEPVMTHGAYSGIDRAILLHPELANQSLQNKPRTKMPRFDLDRQRIELFIDMFGGLPGAVKNAVVGSNEGILICLPNSDVFGVPESLATWIRQTVDLYSDHTAVFLKYHPRERKEPELHLGINSRIFVIPRTIPAELICALGGSNLSAVYAEASSILITCRWVTPELEAYSVNWTGYTLPTDLEELFIHLGIHTIDSNEYK